MLLDIIKSIFYVGLPLALFSFLMVYYAYHRGYLLPEHTIKTAFDKKNKNRALSKQNKKELQFLYSKWVSFGGGFYGLVSLLTFIYIELEQVFQFLLTVTGIQSFIDLLTIGTLINMIVESFINMITALLWFGYWPDIFDIGNGFIWILSSYGGYQLGAHLAQRYAIYNKDNLCQE